MNFKHLLAIPIIALAWVSPAKATTSFDGIWFKASEQGRGYSVEIDGQTKKTMIGIFAYSATGANVWYVSSGTMDGDNYNGRLTSCTNGATLGGTYRAPTCIDGGAVTLALSSVNGTLGATISWGGGTVALTQYNAALAAPYFNAPVTGWYLKSTEPGTGAFFQAWGSTSSPRLFGIFYVFAANGTPVWYVVDGVPVVSSNATTTLSGTLTFCPTGQPLNANYVAPSCGNGGNVTVQFGTNTTATITWPNGSTTVMGRFSVNG